MITLSTITATGITNIGVMLASKLSVLRSSGVVAVNSCDKAGLTFLDKLKVISVEN
jgi:hypothetical protein